MEPGSSDRVAAVYEELRGIAGRLLAGERSGHTLQPTALLHEAWLRLARRDASWADNDQFVRAAAGTMRRVLVDHARARGRVRRGGGRGRVTLATDVLGEQASPADVIATDEALKRLADLDPELVQIAELRVFGAMSNPAIAAALGTSLRSVERGWRVARAFLVQALGGDDRGP